MNFMAQEFTKVVSIVRSVKSWAQSLYKVTSFLRSVGFLVPSPQNVLNCRNLYGAGLAEFTENRLRKPRDIGINTAWFPDDIRIKYLTYLLTHSLTPWCRIFFEKLIVTHLVKQ